ncbi:tetratricopeptide repeat protein, partial [Bacteroidota bacterium]
NYIDFLKLLINEDKDEYKNLKSFKERRINKIQQGDKSSPYYRYCLADIYMQWALIKFKYDDYFGSGLDAKKAYRLLLNNQKLFPSFIPNLKGLGLFHAGFGTAPDEAHWFMQLISLEGTVEQGISEMKKLVHLSFTNKEYSWLRIESLVLLTFMEMNLVSDNKKVVALKEIYEDKSMKELMQTNPLLVFSYANMMMKTGNNDKAIEILLDCPKGNQYYTFDYINYLTGLAKFRRLDKDAYQYLFSYVLNYKGQNYIKSAYQKIAWFYLINNQQEKYREYMNRVISYGSRYVDGDKQALKEAKSGNIPNIYLLKARVLFDGGYYEMAIKILNSVPKEKITNNNRDKIEFTYRMGRIFHEWGKEDKAIPYYKETIKNGIRYTYYFAANAALQLGYINETAENYELARYYYKKCLSMNFDEYKDSIQKKAKAGLNRIKFK